MKYLGLIIGLLLFACASEDAVDEPIPEDEFVRIMADIYVADNLVMHEVAKDAEGREKYFGYYKTVFDKHNITKDQFNKAYDYYANDLEAMKRIVSKVQKRVAELGKE